MLETLLYLVAAVIAIVVLIEVTPPGASAIALIFAAIAFFAVLAAARHGPAAIAAVLNALARLLGR